MSPLAVAVQVHHRSPVVTPGPTPRADRNFPKAGAVRTEDVTFVLDKLTGRAAPDTSGRSPSKHRPWALPWEGGPRIDTRRVAMVGHSAGGFSAIPAMLRDTRIKAAVNMDGNYHFPNDTPVDRPLLMLGRPSDVPGGRDGTWDETWTELTGWKRWLTVDGFLDTHLRGRERPLLDGPSARYPEVRFHCPRGLG